MAPKVNILLADDHQLLLDGLHDILSVVPRVDQIFFANDGKKALDVLSKEKIDILFLDLNMPELNGYEVMKIISRNEMTVKVIGLSMIDEIKLIQKFIQLGAVGFMLKNSGRDAFVQAIEVVMNGRDFYDDRVAKQLFLAAGTRQKSRGPLMNKLSRREKEILQLIIREYKTSEIADELNISFGTVETHRRNLINKIGVRNTAGLVRVAIEYGLVD